jgi:tetratricopeptide (TPR) repeat protein
MEQKNKGTSIFGSVIQTNITSLSDEITEAIKDTNDTTTRTEAKVDENSSKLDELLAIARAGGINQKAADQGISEAAVRAIVERLGQQGLSKEDLVPWLDQWIVAAVHELGKRTHGTNEGEAFEAAAREAEKRFRAGRLNDASNAFMEELTRSQTREQERVEEHKRQSIRLIEEAIRYDMLAFNGESAAQKLRIMAHIEGVEGSDALGEWLFEKAGAYSEIGDQKGDNAALLVAIATYREALKEFTRERDPLNWAMTQNNLGNALSTLGERESGVEKLKEAVSAYRAALQERTRERVPLEWAMTQNNMGNALQTLGGRESGVERLNEAVSAYRAALEEWARERDPLKWAMTQNNLGTALLTLGARESGVERLNEAVSAYRAALEERTRERVPLEWAMTQNNLGTALWRLGERESGVEKLNDAVSAYRAALEEYTRERDPLKWAGTQNNLGNALLTLGQLESGVEKLNDAVSAYRAALKEFTRERVPLDWAGTWGNMGVAMRVIADRERDLKLAEQALAQIEEAAQVSKEGGHTPNAALFENQATQARALVETLRQKK